MNQPSSPANTHSPESPREPRSAIRIVLIAFACIAILGSAFAISLYYYATSPGPHSGQKKEVRIYIPPRSGVRDIKTVLIRDGIIADDSRFIILAKIMGVARQLKAGEYIFPTSHSPKEVLRDLAAGKTVLRAITIPEGTNIFQMAKLLNDQGWSNQDHFLSLAQSQSAIRKLGFNLPSLEGYLFPDTYFFPKGETIEAIVKKMITRTNLVLQEECKKSNAKGMSFDCTMSRNDTAKAGSSANNRLSNHQVLTLASIVEKETGLAEERPLVAEVFLNRLKRKMKLQADPTVIYGLKKFGQPLSKKDLKTASPYNTYYNKGLPIGPICNPGRGAIAAVFQPAEKSYYYFVSQDNGSHYFSKSLREHNRAVRKFRQMRSSQKK